MTQTIKKKNGADILRNISPVKEKVINEILSLQ